MVIYYQLSQVQQSGKPLKLVITHSGRLSARVVRLGLGTELEVSDEVGVGIGVVDDLISAECWASITVLAMVQPKFVDPISVYVHEKQEGYPDSVLELLLSAISIKLI